jgi:hypothetical protein
MPQNEDLEEASSLNIRKSTDSQQDRIDSLIEEEPDSRARLTLMVMSSINKSIAANTELTYAVHREVKALKRELEGHIEAEEALKNKSAGIYLVMKVLVPALWGVALLVLGSIYTGYGKFQDRIEMDLAKIQVRLSDVDTRLSIHIGEDRTKSNGAITKKP